MEIGCFQNHSVSWLLRWGSGIQDDDSDEGGWKRRFDDSFIENMNNEIADLKAQITEFQLTLDLLKDNGITTRAEVIDEWFNGKEVMDKE